MTTEERYLIEAFNRNVEWLKKNRNVLSVPNEKYPEWIGAEEAMKILGRGRTWLKSRMMEEMPTLPCNTNWFLIRSVDYERENGKILAFRSDSILRLKSEMRRMGSANFVPEFED